MGPMRRWVATFERLLNDNEKGKFDTIEKEFLDWAKRNLTETDGFRNVKYRNFQRSERILSVEVEIDNVDRLFPAQIPTFGNWIVIQVERFLPNKIR
jgi:hypothetical protein